MTDTSPDAAHLAGGQRTTFMLTIWPESPGHIGPIWRGVLETRDGHRHYFHTPDGLLHLLTRLSGLPDTPTPK